MREYDEDGRSKVIEQQAQEIERLNKQAKDAFRYAYEQGHHDTVESQYMGCGDPDSECYDEWLADYLAEQEQR